MGLDSFIQKQQVSELHYMRKHGFMHRYISEYLNMNPMEVVCGSYVLDKDFFEMAIRDMKRILEKKDFKFAMEVMPLPEDGFYFGTYMYNLEIKDKKRIKFIKEDYFECVQEDLKAFEDIYNNHDWTDLKSNIIYNASW